MRRFLPFLVLACLFGCETKSPEAPTYGDPPATNFTRPESTLATLARAVHDRSITNYGQCFADTLLEGREFHAVHDQADVLFWQNAGHPITIVDWRRNDELTLFPQFVANYPDFFYDTYFTIDDSRGGVVDIGGPTQKQVWNMHYRVWAGTTPVAAGSAGLTFERVGLATEYKITYWEDRRDTVNVRTWGLHRLEGR